MGKRASTIGYALIVFAAGASYGFTVPAVKVSMQFGVHPTEFLPLQYLIAFCVCLAFALVRRAKWPRPMSCAKMALLGIFTGCTSICYYESVTLLPSAAALTLLFQYVWVSVVIECIAYRRLPERSTVIAVVIVMVGTVFAAGLLEGSAQKLDPLGVAFGAASAVSYALFLFCSGRVCAGERPAVRTTMLTVGGLITTSIVNPGCYATDFFNPGIWPFAVVMATLAVILPLTLINFASPKLSTGVVSVMASSELPVGIFAAWAIVGDQPSPLTLFGAFLVLAGIVVKQLFSKGTLRVKADGS